MSSVNLEQNRINRIKRNGNNNTLERNEIIISNSILIDSEAFIRILYFQFWFSVFTVQYHSLYIREYIFILLSYHKYFRFYFSQSVELVLLCVRCYNIAILYCISVIHIICNYNTDGRNTINVFQRIHKKEGKHLSSYNIIYHINISVINYLDEISIKSLLS